MRPAVQRYPVDRYLDDISMKTGVVTIDDEPWESEAALRPEDEVLLRRLQGLLQATATDLAQLTRELAPMRAPAPAPRPSPAPTPAPLDDNFNQRVHIERLVDEKFHGKTVSPLDTTFTVKAPRPNPKPPQHQSSPVVKNVPKKLSFTHTRILEIDEKLDKNAKNRLNNGKVVNKPPPVTCKEFSFKYEEPQVPARSKFKIQDMPSINIRSELKEQKVLQLDIYPESKQSSDDNLNKGNVAVIAVQHEVPLPKEDPKIVLTNKSATTTQVPENYTPTRETRSNQTMREPVRKISKMSTCESSGSIPSSDTQYNLKTQKQIKSVIKSSPRTEAMDRRKSKKSNIIKKQPEKGTHLNLDEWKKRVNKIYGQSATSNRNRLMKQFKKAPKQSNLRQSATIPQSNLLNNAEYIPYSRLTLGGARVSDIEREISSIPNKSDIPLSPILDKILSSKENSPRKFDAKNSPRIFTTSDENLLQEVIDIEKKVSKMNKNLKVKLKTPEEPHLHLPDEENDEKGSKDDEISYDNDFEEDHSDNTQGSEKNTNSDNLQSRHSSQNNNSENDSHDDNIKKEDEEATNPNRIVIQKSNLSIKNSVDVFEFVHLVDTQDTATQSNRTHKISLKETQTSPRNEKLNIQPIHNDLWPLDPQGEVEKMFKLEKEFIKKLIIEEYGDILEKNITKPSTSNENVEDVKINVTSLQKITQTSPAHVKSVMTSPTKTKTQKTSPYLTIRVDHQTSPMLVVTNEEHLTVELENEEDGISVNLSSPRFSLQLPQTSREVLSNLEIASVSSEKMKSSHSKKVKDVTMHHLRKNRTPSSSTSEIETSSELSSLGEVKCRLKNLRKRITDISMCSDTSSESSGQTRRVAARLRSEGEVSLSTRYSRRDLKHSNKTSKSEGEASLGRAK